MAIKCSAVRSAVWRNLGNVGLADTLVYVDFPLVTHHWFVTKLADQGSVRHPQGRPDNSPTWSSTMDSYKVL